MRTLYYPADLVSLPVVASGPVPPDMVATMGKTDIVQCRRPVIVGIDRRQCFGVRTPTICRFVGLRPAPIEPVNALAQYPRPSPNALEVAIQFSDKGCGLCPLAPAGRSRGMESAVPCGHRRGRCLVHATVGAIEPNRKRRPAN